MRTEICWCTKRILHSVYMTDETRAVTVSLKHMCPRGAPRRTRLVSLSARLWYIVLWTSALDGPTSPGNTPRNMRVAVGAAAGRSDRVVTFASIVIACLVCRRQATHEAHITTTSITDETMVLQLFTSCGFVSPRKPYRSSRRALHPRRVATPAYALPR